MKSILSALLKLQKHSGLNGQIMRFLIVGGVATLIDLLFYVFFMSYCELDASWAKRFSFVLGSFWAFFMHKIYTFQQSTFSKKQPFLFILVYSIGWWVNSAGHDFALQVLGLKSIAYLIGTALSTVCNFILQKYGVFQDFRQTKGHDRARH